MANGISKKIINKVSTIFQTTSTNNCQGETTQTLVKHILIVAQPTGFLPLYNISSLDINKILFKRLSWKTIYTLLLGIFTLYMFISSLILIQKFPIPVGHMVNATVFGNASFSLFNSFLMAKYWKSFIRKVLITEKDFLIKYGKPKSLKVRFLFLNYTLICFGIVESISTFTKLISQYGAKGFMIKIHLNCAFYFKTCGIFWDIIFWVASWLIWLIWLVGDILIITLSIIFASKFRQISLHFESKIKYEHLKSRSKGSLQLSDQLCKYFNQVRQDYNRLNETVKELNNILGNLIFCSYASNLFITFVQIFNSLRPFNSTFELINFLYSFVFIILRIIIVTIAGSSVNEESKRFARILYRVPDEIWNLDLDRLLSRIHLTSSALTGANHFKITKELFLNMAGTIVTYVMILIQFYQTAFQEIRTYS